MAATQTGVEFRAVLWQIVTGVCVAALVGLGTCTVQNANAVSALNTDIVYIRKAIDQLNADVREEMRQHDDEVVNRGHSR